ncbi:hypothetical protein sscle_01g000340 [Sclerotinia sclerotiorum 1980 UF-70]|uniref:DUF6590 domain-containing protein n=2 Tax=Sclerotinia sclerotiorum (strain ATCC 18683 / 1980 / Ss-1) TaxID=665079 RepID=A0A1D9PRD8_SCLS1|nr:hypothetical protein sscle_01g000340 [Sclerotinia sclerotiorum 1980 UF-70]
MSQYEGRVGGPDQINSGSEWALNDSRYYSSYRTGPAGVQETITYGYPEPENSSSMPRTPGPTGTSVASNQHYSYSSPIAARNNVYTTSQTREISGWNNANPMPSYNFPAPINHHYDSSNSLSQNYDTLPPTNTFNTARSFQYPSANNVTWLPTGGVASSSFNATISGMNSMSLMTPQTVPSNHVDSQIAQQQPSGTRYISSGPNTDNTGTLDPRYQVHAGLRENDFWIVGRVFMVLWTEPAQPKVPAQGGTRNGSHFSTTYLGQQAYSEIRRFVVVLKQHGSSICCPIHTYSNQATLKPNLPLPERHTIIHTTSYVPRQHSCISKNGTVEMENLILDPIRVMSESSDREGELNKFSRLNYSKVYTVEHYVRVLNIGKVARESMNSLSYGYNQSASPVSSQRPRRHRPPANSSYQSSSRRSRYHNDRESREAGRH